MKKKPADRPRYRGAPDGSTPAAVLVDPRTGRVMAVLDEQDLSA